MTKLKMGEPNMREQIRVSELKRVSILCEDDVYDLACLLLRINDARDKGTNCKSRQTVKGVAGKYAMLTNISHSQVEAVFEQHGLPFGATVEHDEDVR